MTDSNDRRTAESTDRPTKSVDEFAERYDSMAAEYDEKYDLDDSENEEYASIVSLVVEHANAGPGDTVVDLGAGTGFVTFELAEDADEVVGRDISEEMVAKAHEKAAERGIENASFDVGSFREPHVDDCDIVVSNLAIHHLDDEGKQAAIETVADLEPRQFVIGTAMFFDERDPDDPVYDPDIVYPATVGNMVCWLTDAGFTITAVEKVSNVVGVLVAEYPETS